MRGKQPASLIPGTTSMLSWQPSVGVQLPVGPEPRHLSPSAASYSRLNPSAGQKMSLIGSAGEGGASGGAGGEGGGAGGLGGVGGAGGLGGIEGGRSMVTSHGTIVPGSTERGEAGCRRLT